MRRTLALLTLALALAPALALRAAEPPAGAEQLAAEAARALGSWKYEKADELLQKLAKLDPTSPRLPVLKLRLLVRTGRFEAAAKLAAGMKPGAAAELSVEEALKVGRALLDAGKRAEARTWILAAARRAGPGSPERYLDSLAALLAPGGGHGLATSAFAAELASPERKRAEAAEAYNRIAAELARTRLKGAAARYLELAAYAAQRRLAELSEAAPPPLPRRLAGATNLAWRAPVGVDELPEHFALGGRLLLVGGQVNGRALPRRPLPARLRAFDARTGKALWKLDLAPQSDPQALGAGPADGVAYSSRLDGLVATERTACALVKTNRSERQGASRRTREVAAALLGVDLERGKVLWTVNIPPRGNRLYLAGDTLVVAGFRSLAGYSMRDGATRWSQDFERSFSGAAAVAAGGLILPGWKQNLCVDAAKGTTRWQTDRAPGSGFAQGCLVGDGVAVIAEKGTGVHGITCLEAATGKKLWARNFMASASGTDELVLALAGRTLVACRGAALRGLAARSGKNSWSAALPLPAEATRPRLLGWGNRVLWTAGGELVLLDATGGRPLWWSPSSLGRPEPLGALTGGKENLVFTLEGSSPRTLSAWRARPPGPEESGALGSAGRKLAELAGRLAAGGRPRAAGRLLEIARTYATPGVLEVEWAALGHEMKSGGRSPALERRGLLRAALAAAAGGKDRQAALKLFRSVLGGKAEAGGKCLAAAALLVLGDEAGKKHLAANQGAWTAADPLMKAVLAACRLAGAGSKPVLLAGLKSDRGKARATLVERLAAYRGQDVREALGRMLADGSREVRVAAAGSLAASAGREAVPLLAKALEKEQDFFTKNRLRSLLAGLGHRVGPVVKPRPEPRPEPRPQPRLSRAQALEAAGRRGRILWKKDDPGNKLFLWIAVEKNFLLLYNAADGSLSDYGDFLKMVGRKEVSVAGAAFGADSVWAATDKGAFVLDRRTRAWSQLVINLDFDLLEAHIEKVEMAGGKVTFTVKGQGRYRYDTKSKKWGKL